MESFNIPERGEDEDSPRGVVPAEEAHVARLLGSDSRELLELLRPLREDVQLLREVSELTRLGRGRTLSAGRRRSVRHGDGEGVDVCTGVTARYAASGWNGGSRQRVLQHLAHSTRPGQAGKGHEEKGHIMHVLQHCTISSNRPLEVENAACSSLAEGEPPPPDFERRRIHQHDLARLAKLGHEDDPHAFHRLVFALGRRLDFDQARLEARLVPDKVDVRRLMQDERVSVRKREAPCEAEPCPCQSQVRERETFDVRNSQSVSGHVGAMCDHSSVCIATPSRSSPSRYLKMSSTVCPEVPKKLRDRPLLSSAHHPARSQQRYPTSRAGVAKVSPCAADIAPERVRPASETFVHRRVGQQRVVQRLLRHGRLGRVRLARHQLDR